MIRRWLYARAAGALNRHVAESTAAADRAARLEGRSFHVHVEGLALDCVLRVAGGRIVVDDDVGRPADASVSGTPLDLARLLGPDIASRLPGSAAKLTGAVRVAEGFTEMLRLAAPDPEEALARWIGDVAAHGAGSAARASRAWAARAAEALRLDAVEFLQEESRAVPGAHEAEAFYADVERLRDDVERTVERVEVLEKRIAGR